MSSLRSMTESLRRVLEGKEKKGQSACCVVENDKGQVMLLQRGDTAPWMPGKWNLPGGMVDPGETPAQAAAREADEEVGISVTEMKLLARTGIPGLPNEELFVYHVTKWSGTPKVNYNESKAMAWADKSEAWKYDLVPPLPKILKKLAK